MNEPSSPQFSKSTRTPLIVWGIVASLTSVIFAFTALVLFLDAQKTSIAQNHSTERPFASVPENTIPGRYKWIEDGQQIGTVTLHPDHSITNWRGERKAGYKWQLQQEGLLLEWLKGFNLFTHIIRPGIYEGWREGKIARMEKGSAQTEEKLLPPPAGFSWQPFKEINASCLKPPGWFFKHAKQDDTEAFFLTQEDIDRDGFFTTGLTLNCIRDLRNKTGKTPSSIAMTAADEAASAHDLLERSSTDQGSFKIVKFRFASVRPDHQNITTQNVLVANDHTNTLYLLIFEAPTNDWGKAWKTGEVLLAEIKLDVQF